MKVTIETTTQLDRDLATIQRALQTSRTMVTNLYTNATTRQKNSFILTVVILFLCGSNLLHDSSILVHDRELQRREEDAFYRAGHKLDIVQLAREYIPTKNNHTAAVCFKTLFGDIDLGIVIQWAAYHRLLGFDQIFMWYRPEMEAVPRFQELKTLPFVTLTLNTEGKRSNYFNQWETEIKCLKEAQFANNYSWAMLADIDEYLRFGDGSIGIKDFLQRHDNMTYLSFGKQMYTLVHRTDLELSDHKIDTNTNDHFAVSDYPFHMKYFCYHKQRKGDPICPTWRGRSKVIVRPTIHQRIDTHGTIHHPNPANGTIHFAPNIAHFMEWPEIFAAHNVTQREAKPFQVQEFEQVHIHNLKRAFQPVDEDGNYQVEFDAGLKEWFDGVMRRGKSDQRTSDQS